MLPRNEAGRDFVIGDIHFKTADLQRGLRSLDFDSKVGRVIGVGDLIGRGPRVLEGLKLLGESWFFEVQGNHEQMLIAALLRKSVNLLFSSWRGLVVDHRR
jgi:serine/threonine protein phosphatase 1